MAYPIQSLKTAMVLAMLCLPIGLGVNVSYFLSGAIKRKKISTSYLGLIISYSTILTVAVLTRIVHPEWVRIRLDVLGILTAIVLGIVCICIEYLAGVLLTLFSQDNGFSSSPFIRSIVIPRKLICGMSCSSECL